MVSNSRDLALALVVVIFAVGMVFTISPDLVGLVLGSNAKGLYRCTDTDGLNSSTQGVVTITALNLSSSKFKDTCINSRNVREYYCNRNSTSAYPLGQQTIQCGTGYACSNGACIKATAPAVTFSCRDTDFSSNGGGRNLGVAGNTTVTISNGTVRKSVDSCLDSIMLDEFYCANATAQFPNHEQVYCPLRSGPQSTCVRGACVNQTTANTNATSNQTQPNNYTLSIPTFTCQDTDFAGWNGWNSGVAGSSIVNISNGTVITSTEFCYGNGNTLYEFYCSSSTARSSSYEAVACNVRYGSQSTCVNGACVNQTTANTSSNSTNST